MPIFDNGKAPITQSAKNDEANVPRSAFNMSRVKYMNGIMGALMPFDVLETLPNEDYTIGYDVLAELRNPTVRKMLNGMKIFIHTYWCPKKDLWRGFKNYIDKGRSGTVDKEVPKLCTALELKGNGEPSADDECTLTPFAPSSFMGLPIAVKPKATDIPNKNEWYKTCSENNGTILAPHIKSNIKWKINAMPFVMYCKIYRDYYANENLLGNNTQWYHEDEDLDLIIPYTPNTTDNYINTANGELVTTTGSENRYVPTKSGEDKPYLNCLYFRQFRGDYFTTANIFRDLIRGDASEIDKQFNEGLTLNWESVFSKTVETEEYAGFGGLTLGKKDDGLIVASQDYANNKHTWGQGNTDLIKSAFEKANVKGLSLNAVRKALILEKFMMRNATTNGSYRELIGVQFGYYPKDYTRKPRYVGGAEYDINFSTINATNYNAEGNTLGQKTSEGYAAGQGYIGKFHSDDHGYLMSIMSIVPDVYYAKQGIDPMFQRITQDKEYFPILNNLEPMAIKNKELYLSEDNAYNEDVWGYADRFEDWKSRRNEVTGLALCGEVYDRAQFMFREFDETSKPQLNTGFMTMTPDNIDMTPFTSVNEPPFDITIGCNIEKVSPMPYMAQPSDMGIKY